ncbi:MAG: ABC transporter permease [Armatimonadota bacterium]
MSTLRLLLRELRHRKLNFALGLLAVVLAVALSVAILTMCEASQRETRRIMRDMGFNLLILPKHADMADFWSRDFAVEEMPEEYVHRLANSDVVTVRHLAARLQREVFWRGQRVLLTGVLPEVPQLHMTTKPPMGLDIPRGKAYVGHALAQRLDIQVGDTIELGGQRFLVDRCLEEKGSKTDIRIFGHLHDVQAALDLPGRINEIEALGCLCDEDRLPVIRQDIARILPDTQVTEIRDIAVARAETRQMVERYAAVIMPAVLLVCAVWVGLLALSNVRERRGEIGILRAMGVRSWPIAVLFLGRAVLLGVVGAALGYAIGTWLAIGIGPGIFKLTGGKIVPLQQLLVWTLVVAPLLCAVAAYLPAMLAVLQDPAEILTEE